MGNTLHTAETIKEFIVDNFLFGDGEKINLDTPLFEKGIIDSTGVLELIAFIEENFNLTVKDEELVQDNFYSLIAIDNFIASKINKTASN
jgi:acyl carrier protein